MPRRAFTLPLILCLGLLSGCAALGSLSPTAKWERQSLYHPRKFPAGEWVQSKVLVQDAQFASVDGVKLHGWYVPNPQPKAHALLLHGNSGNVTMLADTLRLLNQRHQLSVLALDYRGYGKSEGEPSEAGILLDARAARKWLANKAGIAENDVLLLGQSLGGGVAVDLAAKDGCRGLVLASTFTSIPAVAQSHLPWLPMNWLLATRLNSLDKIKQYRGPLLLSHGDADEVVPYKQGQALFAACPSDKKWMITNSGNKHHDPQPEEYRRALDTFVDQLPPLGGETASSTSTANVPAAALDVR